MRGRQKGGSRRGTAAALAESETSSLADAATFRLVLLVESAALLLQDPVAALLPPWRLRPRGAPPAGPLAAQAATTAERRGGEVEAACGTRARALLLGLDEVMSAAVRASCLELKPAAEQWRAEGGRTWRQSISRPSPPFTRVR